MRTAVLRLVVIGCGRVFQRYHLPALRHAPVRLVGAADAAPDRLSWARRAVGDAACFASSEALLDEVAADAALVTTPPRTHAALVEELLQHRGIPVLVEKPLATRLADARRLCELQRQTGLGVRVGFNRRYRASYARARAQALRHGRITRLAFTFIADARRWNGQARSVSSPEEILHDAGSHALDLVAHIAGQPIEKVLAEPRRDLGSRLVHMQLRLAGGVAADCIVGHAPRYEEHLTIEAGARSWTVDTSGGRFAGRLRSHASLAIRKLTRRPTPTDESFRRQLVGFAALCRGTSDDIGADAQAGCAAVAAVEAAMTSLANGGGWEDASYLSDEPKANYE